ncbi:MAG: ribonuclease P protein subunit [Nitrososphaerota archaeon]|nr:ribonuclease P protein subunit [Candidatus Calditenuaceae archaeon]MDW8072949.1 ribonuclease P protein subunit [Nitrososphaerota archaeon]
MKRVRQIISLVGHRCRVTRKSDGASWSELIIGETANTVLIEAPSGVKRIPKRGHIFEVLTERGVLVADGDQLVGRPSQRLKRVRRSWQRP